MKNKYAVLAGFGHAIAARSDSFEVACEIARKTGGYVRPLVERGEMRYSDVRRLRELGMNCNVTSRTYVDWGNSSAFAIRREGYGEPE